MAHIPQEEIDRLKRDVPVADLVRARGIELRGHGENLIGLCPFHDDHDPSLVVTPAKNLWHCMGACQTGGDVFAWVMKAEGIRSFRHAYELLTGGTITSEPARVVKRSEIPKLGSPISMDMSDDELALAVVDYYVETARKSPELRAYLEKRGIDSEEAITHFRLGFANRTLGLRLPSSNRKEGQELRSRLQKIGLLRAESGHEHFNGSLVVPIFDESGNLAQMYGRKITPNLRARTPLHLYLPRPHSAVWNLDALRESKEIILCESLIDALSFWCHGFRNVITSYGVEGFTAAHLEAMKAYGTERVLIAYDRDDAGDRAADKLAARLIAEGIDVLRIEFPRGMDANEYAVKMTPPDKALGVLVRAARWIGKGTRAAAALPDAPPTPIEKPAPSLAADAPAPPASTDVDELVFDFGDRTYRVRGIKRLTSFDSLKINVLLTREAIGAAHLDSFDLSVARQRLTFEKHAAGEIGVAEEVVHWDMGRILLALEEVRRQQMLEATRPKEKKVPMSDDDRAKAIEHLRAPGLVERTVEHITRCGLVGEERNKLMAYLAAVSRKLDEPLAIIVQSSSAAGKTTLMDAVLRMMPDEEQERYSAVTGKALFYIGDETSLRHKILAISEEEGAEHASYALKLLQSEGKLSIASTGKDPQTGKLVTQEYRVEGPVMIFLTTTAIDIDEELLNRCIVLTVNEEREQTRAIHELQRHAQTIEGLVGKREADELRKLHQNAQRLLQPVLVANPYAPSLTFLDGRTRTRRDHMKYLTLIRTIALLHQYQRPRKSHVAGDGASIEYIEVTTEDIALANELAHEVLGRSLDELPPQTRRLLELIDEYVTHECKRRHIERSELRFSRKTIREVTRWGDTQLKVHMHRLEEMEYLLVHRGGRGQSFVYELLFDGRAAGADTYLHGLIDVVRLSRSGLEEERSGQKKRKSGAGRAMAGGVSDGGRSNHTIDNSSADVVLERTSSEEAEKAPLGDLSSNPVVPKLAFPKPERKRGNGREQAPSFSRLRRVPRSER
jgi:DNA primase